MIKTIKDNEYNSIENNKMIISIPYKGSCMSDNKKNITDLENIKVVMKFPETSDDSNYIIDEVKLILVDLFEKTVKSQFETETISKLTKENCNDK